MIVFTAPVPENATVEPAISPSGMMPSVRITPSSAFPPRNEPLTV